MERAEEDQVVEAGRSAVGPVADVVSMEPPAVAAPGEAARARVAAPERAEEGRGDPAGSAPDVEDLTARRPGHLDQRPVAGEPASGLPRKRNLRPLQEPDRGRGVRGVRGG